MSVAKVVELTSESGESFEAAIRTGIERARKSLDGVKGAWIKEQQISIGDDGRMSYRVNMKVTFVMTE